MPYEARAKENEPEVWEVINKDTGEVKAEHEPPDAKEKAEKQVHLLEAVENDPGWE